jgi:hypothetical protein
MSDKKLTLREMAEGRQPDHNRTHLRKSAPTNIPDTFREFGILRPGHGGDAVVLGAVF